MAEWHSSLENQAEDVVEPLIDTTGIKIFIPPPPNMALSTLVCTQVTIQDRVNM